MQLKQYINFTLRYTDVQKNINLNETVLPSEHQLMHLSKQKSFKLIIKTQSLLETPQDLRLLCND
jgi:hypothetical protein